MRPEVAVLLKAIGDEASILLSGFSGDDAHVSAALIRISEATALAYLEHTGELIDETRIKAIEPLNLEDVAKKVLGIDEKEASASAVDAVPALGDQVSGGRSAPEVPEEPVGQEVPRHSSGEDRQA